jgi:hypothetical protein
MTEILDPSEENRSEQLKEIFIDEEGLTPDELVQKKGLRELWQYRINLGKDHKKNPLCYF